MTDERFWKKVAVTAGDGCWEWNGYVRPNGYGQFGRNQAAHRVAYELGVGPIPQGMELDHLCRNRRCVRPSHLEPVSHPENTRRGGAAVKACPQGHPYDEANTYWLKSPGTGRRHCRACVAIARQRRKAGLPSVQRPKSTLCDEDVAKIREAAQSGISQSELARRYGVSVTAIRLIVLGLRRTKPGTVARVNQARAEGHCLTGLDLPPVP